MRIPTGRKRVGATYTLVAAFAVLFVIVGIIWVALAYVQNSVETTALNQYPYGVYSSPVVGLINFAVYAMPLAIFVSVVIMVIIASQRNKRTDQS